MNVRALVASVVGLGSVSVITPAYAVELVEGGYGSTDEAGAPAASATVAEPERPAGPGLGGDPAFLLEFTPRSSGSLLADDDLGGELPRLRFGVAVGAPDHDRFEALGGDVGGTPSWLSEGDPATGLSLGGALRWSGYSVGGLFARTNLFGGDADLMGAQIGYGSVSASLTYGQSDRVNEGPVDVLMLSTDLAAWSWLTVESDVALGQDPERESVAVGRVGLRLSF